MVAGLKPFNVRSCSIRAHLTHGGTPLVREKKNPRSLSLQPPQSPITTPAVPYVADFGLDLRDCPLSSSAVPVFGLGRLELDGRLIVEQLWQKIVEVDAP
jgi:hypothetical protein